MRIASPDKHYTRSSFSHHVHVGAAWRKVLRRDVSLAAVYTGGGQKISRVYMQSCKPAIPGCTFWRLTLFYSYFLQSFNAVGLKWCKAFANKGRWSVYVLVQSTIGMWCNTYPATRLLRRVTPPWKVYMAKWDLGWEGEQIKMKDYMDW